MVNMLENVSEIISLTVKLSRLLIYGQKRRGNDTGKTLNVFDQIVVVFFAIQLLHLLNVSLLFLLATIRFQVGSQFEGKLLEVLLLQK